MECPRFERTERRVSASGFGCWEISSTYGRIDVARPFDRHHRA
jgi:hypothetical protein